jgi:conjugative relaxase-like TrwC/TraI family protein
MLRVVSHKSAAAARQYYAEGLRREDYYSEGQEVAGKWHGKAAALLGLTGDVTPDAFAALVENRHPETGKQLTARMKEGRIVGYDLNFHAPKSLSVLYALTEDAEILKAFRSAVAETMAEIEAQVATRIRKGGAQENRVTGNFAWAEFVHFTARPVGGIPDPHLHVHCFAFNATFDAEESRWKAAKFRDIKQDAPYSEAAFHSRLTEKLVEIGYGIERTRQGWEVTGIPRAVIDKFSRRSAQIDRLAEAKGITDPKQKDALGAATRENKRQGLTHADLLAAWDVRLTADEKATIGKVHSEKGGNSAAEKITPARALDEAHEKLFAKSSVVETKRLVAEALRFGVGQVTPDKVWRELGRREMIVREIKGRVLCTSLVVLAEEVALINYVRSGRGRCAPLAGRNAKIRNEALSLEQNAAVRHILKSRDQVIGMRGAAGAGKTTLMPDVVNAIQASGLKVFAFAPSASASRETLREAGFSNAETVAHLLANRKLQLETRGQVIWIDEAGLVGAADMLEILRIAGDSTRVILTGDTAQHTPVPRGDAFRLMQKYAGLKVAEVTEIRRQVREDYRAAVTSLSQGDLRTAFNRLDELGAIIEIPNDAERYRQLAQDYLALSREDSVPLVVSPTHAESAKVTAAIREAKREAGQLGEEKPFTRYHNLQWEDADKRRVENYREGLVVQFHQNVHGIHRGDVFRVTGFDEKGGVVISGAKGRETTLPLNEAKRFQVFEAREINLARGDRIRITLGGKSADGRRLNNGNIFTVERLRRDGKIVLNTGAVLEPTHGHFTYGFCQTSHSSQSKTVRDVLVAQSADSFLASSREQFYVSVSRGKESIRIYTDNRQELQKAVGNSSTRRSAMELSGLTAKEVAGLVSNEMDGTQWRSMVRSRKDGDTVNHVRNLLRERKQEGTKKPDNFDFRAYIAMRRANAGADGKSRSKGSGGVKGKGKVEAHTLGRAFIRSTEPRIPHKVANENKKAEPASPRQNRLTRNVAAMKSHFQKVTERLKGAAEKFKASRQGKRPARSDEEVSKHRSKQQNADAVKAKTKTKTKQKTTTAVPPGPRKGR